MTAVVELPTLLDLLTLSSSTDHRPLTNVLHFTRLLAVLSRSPQFSPLHIYLNTSSQAVLGATSFPRSLWVQFQGLLDDVCGRFSEGVSNPTTLSP